MEYLAEYQSTYNDSTLDMKAIFNNTCVSMVNMSEIGISDTNVDTSVCVDYFVNDTNIVNPHWNSTLCSFLRDQCLLFDEICMLSTV